jgi:hypothetical protein
VPSKQAAVLQPARLTENLSELGSMLRDAKVAQHTKLLDKNMVSLKELAYFLKKYAEGLKSEAPLKAQRHALEFVLPCAPFPFPRPHSPGLRQQRLGRAEDSA